ncbi:S-layer homology domain-containing protein [Thermovenabulum sp.]|uniref:S-layer homology domain-containing protein n=1 Tax=Thermovenabulum sp. TaxID=3100335 RepID=UPI003C798687
MKSIKKLLALAIIATLVLGLMPVAFAAPTFPDTAGKPFEQAVEQLKALGIVDGYPDGTYKPDVVVTRAQMAKLIVISLGLNNAAEISKGITMFTDVKSDHWASGYINVASSLGIIVGYPDGTFKPEATVSYPEALTMLVRALGYKDSDLPGTWPTNYLVKASTLGITKDVTVTLGGANRGDVASMLMNTLKTKTVKRTNEGLVEDVLLLSKIAKEATYTVIATPEVDSNVEAGKVVTKEGTISAGSINFNDYLGRKVTVFEKDDKPIVVTKVEGDVVTVEASKDSVSGIVYYKKDDKTPYAELKVATNAKMVYNGTLYDVNFGDIKTGAKVTLIDTDSDKTYDYLIVKYYDAPVVVAKDVVANATKIYTEGSTINLTTDDEGKVDLSKVNVKINGVPAKLENIKKDDVLYIAKDKETKAKMELYVIRKTVSGKFTEIKDGKYVIGGVEYEVINAADSLLGKDVKALLGENNKIVKLAEVSTTAVENYGYITVTGKVYGAFGVESYQVKMVKPDGTTAVLTVEKSKVDDGYIDFNAIAPGFVKYTVNEKNEINAQPTPVTLTILSGYTVDTTNNKLTKANAPTYYINSDTVVYNVDGSTVKVVKFADYDYTGVTLKVLVSDDNLNNVKYLITEGTLTSKTDTGTKVFIKSVSKIADNKARFYAVKLDGTSVAYDSTLNYADYTTAKGVYSLTIDKDGKVTKIEDIINVPKDEVLAKTSTRINIGGTVYDLASTVTVFDKDGNKLTMDDIVVKTDYVDGSQVKAYKNTDVKIEIIVIEQ